MKKRPGLFFLAGTIALMFSCSTKEKEVRHEDNKAELVFRADSLLFNNIEPDSALALMPASEVAEWSGDFFSADTLGDVKWILADFFRIDSLKSSGKYTDYVEHLDLGMTRDVVAKKINEVRLDDKSVLKVWMLQHGSYEACPFTSGIEVLGTLIYEGKVQNCFLIGQELHSSDPPVWLSKEKYADIYSNGLVRIQSKESDCEGEVDKKNNDIVNTRFEEVSFIVRNGQVADKVTKSWEK